MYSQRVHLMSTLLHNQDRIVLTGVEKAVELSLPYGARSEVPAARPLKLSDPTLQVCHEFVFASRVFNKRLFGDRLRPCIVTLQRQRGAAGYFAEQRFETRDGTLIVDEIGLNPECFHRCVTDVLSTLVHEQVHLLAAQYGHPSRNGYHTKLWAEWMERVGLIPSHTGAPGGRRTGVRVSHYINSSGEFARACADLIADGFDISFFDRWAVMRQKSAINEKRRKSKKASKTRFSCPACDANAWGKPNLSIDCRPCDQPMVAA